jgi:hypothetical protein
LEWAEIVEAFEQTTESHEGFCRRRGLNVGSFRGWLYRLRAEREQGKVARSATPRMLPVRVQGERLAPEPELAVIQIGVAGTVVRIAVGTDLAYVGDLVSVLRERC